MIISFKGYDDSGGLHINHMDENQPNRTNFHRFGYKLIKRNDQIYQLTDLYTLFYMQFCHKATTDEHYWTNMMGKPVQNTWYGLSFERVCMLHIP